MDQGSPEANRPYYSRALAIILKRQASQAQAQAHAFVAWYRQNLDQDLSAYTELAQGEAEGEEAGESEDESEGKHGKASADKPAA